MEDNTTSVADASADEAVETGSVTSEEVLSITGHEAPEVESTEEEADEEEAEGADGDAEAEESVETAEETTTDEAQAEAEADADASTDVPDFAVTVEDSKGNSITINPGDNLEEVLADFEPKNNGQIFQIIKDVMSAEQAKTTYDQEQVEAQAAAEHQAQLTAIQEGWDKEIAELEASKRVPGGEDGKARAEAVFKYMAEQNEKRQAAGKPLIQSFEDALDKMELHERNEADAEKKKQAKADARKRGGLVGGSSAPATNGGPVYRGGARNATEAARLMGLL